MRLIVSIAAALMFLSSFSMGQDDLFTPMKGSATPEFQTLDGQVRCLVFGKHVVKLITGEEGGETIQMFDREGTAKGKRACQLSSNPYATIKDDDNNAFYGISAVYFFVDSGTAAGTRTLMVYKTDSGDEVTNVDYFSDTEPRIEATRYLYYDAVSPRKGPLSACPQAAKYKRDGGGVVWLQSKKLDLDTLKTVNIGTLHCGYLE